MKLAIEREVLGEHLGDEGRSSRVIRHREEIRSLMNLTCPNAECGVEISLDFEACFAVTCMTCRYSFLCYII